MRRIRDAIELLLKHPHAVTFEHLGIVARADDCAKHNDLVGAITLMKLLTTTLPEKEQAAYLAVLEGSRQVEVPGVS